MGFEPPSSREYGRIIVAETCIDAAVEKGFLKLIEGFIVEARGHIERKISADASFQTTFEPYPARPEDPPIVRMMCDASKKAGVGPMAAVAGAIDAYVLGGLREAGCRHALLDNDGDIAVTSDGTFEIGFYTGIEEFSGLSIALEPEGRPLSICTSSGKIGHSVSLGNSDIASVISEDPALADACATALGNYASDDPVAGAEEICNIDGIVGCLLIADGCVITCGDFPEIHR